VPGARVVTDARNNLFYDKIDLVRDGCRFRFLLIPLRPDDKKRLPTFYILENKVSVARFRCFATSMEQIGQWKLKSKEWDKADSVGGDYPQDNYPVFNVHVEDAYQFARWLGGNLPATAHWDKAAGRYEANPGEGPYREPWDKNDPKQIAVGRGGMGPMPCGAATHDISVFGCRDMAANGREWTRILSSGSRVVPLAQPTSNDFVLVRGHTYRASFPPLMFKHLDFEEENDRQDVGTYREPSADIGFRVVIEP